MNNPNFRSILPVVLLLSAFFLLFACPAKAQSGARPIAVMVDGLPVSFDVQPVLQDNRILVPFRAIAEALNIEVDWDGQTKTVSTKEEDNQIWLQIGNRKAYRNGKEVILDVPPQLLNGRTMIPLRFFSEACGCQVQWDPSLPGAWITSPPAPMTVIGFYALGDSRTSSWTNLFGTAYPKTAPGHTDIVNEIALGWYSLNEQGELLTSSRTGWQRPEGWEDVLAAAREYNVRTEMVVHLTDTGSVLSRLLADETAADRAAAAIAAEALLFQGVNLDFEGLGWRDDPARLQEVREDFNRFVRNLAQRLRENDRTLTLTLHAPNSAYLGYDYQTLGQLADQIIVMAYDYGPVPEPADLVLEAMEMAGATVPADRLVLGISLPSETADSINTKIGLVKKHKWKGVALWRLGLVTPEEWQTIRGAVQARF